MAAKKANSNKQVETLIHEEARRKNIPTAEFQSVVQKEANDPLTAAYPRNAAGLDEEKTNRNRDLDPQLVWRGKDEQGHAYFLGANDPYKALKTTLKAEINQEAWASLNSDISRPFDKPKSGRIAVKVINHLGDEVMKVFKV